MPTVVHTPYLPVCPGQRLLVSVLAAVHVTIDRPSPCFFAFATSSQHIWVLVFNPSRWLTLSYRSLSGAEIIQLACR